jgi:PAS domain S-box-containing protein
LCDPPPQPQVDSARRLFERRSRRAHVIPPAARLPRTVVWIAVALCLVPQLLHLAGVDLGWEHGDEQAARVVHAVLEWTAFATASGVTLMSFASFRAERDLSSPVLGLGLLCAGTMDALHALASAGVITTVPADDVFIPFTWFLSRLANALILIVGLELYLWRRPRAPSRAWAPGAAAGLAVAFGVLAWALIHLSATSDRLPRTLDAGTLVSRPWDLLPLALFVVSGLSVYPRFHRARPGLVSHALLVSAVPQVAAQLHMTFGSELLWDAHFNIAHGLKVLAYSVPLVGLLLDDTRARQSLILRSDQVARAVEEIERKEAPFLRLYESNIMGIFIGDVHGNINKANDAFLSMIGYERDELPIRWVDLTPPEWLPRDEEAIRECHERGVVPVWEKEYLHKDGTRIPILLAVAMLDMDAGTCICPILDLSERSRLEKAVLDQSETERRRLAANLHDDLGQHLTGLALLAAALQSTLEEQGSPQAAELSRIRERADQAVSMARTMAQFVSPADLASDGLGPALERLASNSRELFRVRCEFTHDDGIAVKDDMTATHLFHIAQEAITNAVKHGQAARIQVDLSIDGGELRLCVADDGVGMPDDMSGKLGMGLGIMNHRARMIGATLRHDPGPDGGTCVTCRMPLQVRIT